MSEDRNDCGNVDAGQRLAHRVGVPQPGRRHPCRVARRPLARRAQRISVVLRQRGYPACEADSITRTPLHPQLLPVACPAVRARKA